MWHLGLRKEKEIVALVLIFVAIGILITVVADECSLISCPVVPATEPAVLDYFEVGY